MGSHRIRTELGINKRIDVKLEQDFDFLEILSLKFQPDEVYPRQCSDHGVIVGRVIVNGGYGVPNAKISVFIPLSPEDELDPIISTLYPYKKISDVNEDGYRYNLLPYEQQHGGHTPTGSFPSLTDAISDQAVIEVYDKYYKFTAKTNDSGDYMIFGVPLGNQTVFLDLDLSDMGPFSLTPQDLIRMGLANEGQVNGSRFNSSENIDSLPQIVSQAIEVSVDPFWGQEDVCQASIQRLDFDLRKMDINIEPTAVFMGSMFSDSPNNKISRKCKPAKRSGYLCDMVTSPGEILAIRQTIFNDADGRPVLEEFSLGNSGKVIDHDGTWLVDLPMNMDYVTTDEFGNTVPSMDPSVGLPTTAKYRFKIKWQQSKDLNDGVKRGYYLVPNTREYWKKLPNGLLVDPVPPAYGSSQPPPTDPAIRYSYPFSLDWSDYGDPMTTDGQQMIDDAINCEDKFYPFRHKKVYTVSSFIDQYHHGSGPKRFIGIKHITDQTCETENNKFPITDGMKNANIQYSFNVLLLSIIYWLLILLLPLVHLVMLILQTICKILDFIIKIAKKVGIKAQGLRDLRDSLCGKGLWLKLPMLTFPDCEFCECDGKPVDVDTTYIGTIGNNDDDNDGPGTESLLDVQPDMSALCGAGPADKYPVSALLDAGNYHGDVNGTLNDYQLMSWNKPWRKTSLFIASNPLVPDDYEGKDRYYSCELPVREKINLFNTKAKYFDGDFGGSVISAGVGGANQIKVTVEPTMNQGSFHLDNVYIMLASPNDDAASYSQGRIISFQDPSLSNDPNIADPIIGTSNTGISQITVKYANPNDTPLTITPVPLQTTYNVNFTNTEAKYDYPTDIEYFQVITAMTITEFMSLVGTPMANSLPVRYLNYIQHIKKVEPTYSGFTGTAMPGSNPQTYDYSEFSDELSEVPCEEVSIYNKLLVCSNKESYECDVNGLANFNDSSNIRIVIMNRGVDVNTERVEIEYDLSRLFGRNTYASGSNDPYVVTGSYKLNVPIQPGYHLIRHNALSDNMGSGMSGHLFHPSFNSDFSGTFIGYQTNLHTFYSSLDASSVAQGFIVNGLYPWSQLTNQHAIETGTGGLRTSVPVDHSCADYHLSTFFGMTYGEYIEGGSYSYQGKEGTYSNSPQCIFGSFDPDPDLCEGNERTFVYFAPKYDGNLLLAVNSASRLVFRSDRLPTSTQMDIEKYYGNIATQNNFPAGQQNNNFLIYLYPDTSGSFQNWSEWLEVMSPSDDSSDSSGALDELFEGYDFGQQNDLVRSLGCEHLVDLSCYGTNPLHVNGPDHDCNKTTPPLLGGILRKKIAIEKGCYILAKSPIVDLVPGNNRDLAQLTEWYGRMKFNMAACFGLLSHNFVNSWVNGTLYHFAIKNNRFFNSNNQPYSLYCSDVAVLEPDTNTFYYRSSPYDVTNNAFVGKKPPANNRANDWQLGYPTTIMDLGPLTDYTKELVLEPYYDGYVMDKMKPSSYSDVNDLMQLFILSRMINASTLSFVAGNGPDALFRNGRGNHKKRFDGDYAQQLQINTQFGVHELSPDQYSDNDFYISATIGSGLFGVWFNANNDDRDLISPRRVLFNDTAPLPVISQQIPTFSQKVPHYSWKIDNSNTIFPTIFGNQDNDWWGSVGTHRYQSFDRVLQPYFMGMSNQNANTRKGFIYKVDASGNNNPLLQGEQNITMIGNPWYFYFGLRNAATAFDKFYMKYME